MNSLSNIDVTNNDNAVQLLSFLMAEGKINDKDVAILGKNMNKSKIDKLHKYKIYQTSGRWCTYIYNPSYKNHRQQIAAPTEDALYEQLCKHYLKAETLSTVFEKWIAYSEKETARKAKTIQEDRNVFKAYLKEAPIAKKDITKLDECDFKNYFDNLFKKNPTKKQVLAIKTLIKQIYSQARMDGLKVTNPVTNLDAYFKTKIYRQPEEEPGYSDEERNKLLIHLLSQEKPDVYDYAIALMFCMTIRIGELKALKWSVVTEDTIYICRQLDSENKECDIKKNTGKGRRYVGIPELAHYILNQLSHDGTYILEKDGKPLLTDSFNRRLKQRCDECGIRYLSSHKIRFANCTMLLDKDIAIRAVQKDMGHTSIEMTEHYYREHENRKANDEITNAFNDCMQVVCNEIKKTP